MDAERALSILQLYIDVFEEIRAGAARLTASMAPAVVAELAAQADARIRSLESAEAPPETAALLRIARTWREAIDAFGQGDEASATALLDEINQLARAANLALDLTDLPGRIRAFRAQMRKPPRTH